MKNKEEIERLLLQAGNILYKSEKFEEKAMSIAQRIGLQGEKRRMRYESVKSHNMVNYLKCDSFDVYGTNLVIHHQEVNMPEVSSIKSYFEIYLSKIWEQHDALHNIANQLVIAGAKHIAECLYKKCSCLIDDIKYFTRTIREGNAVNWNPEFIYLHQTTMCNIHDEFEKKEEEIHSYPA